MCACVCVCVFERVCICVCASVCVCVFMSYVTVSPSGRNKKIKFARQQSSQFAKASVLKERVHLGTQEDDEGFLKQPLL